MYDFVIYETIHSRIGISDAAGYKTLNEILITE